MEINETGKKAMPIRVLQVTSTMNRGGAETLLIELYKHIDRSRVQFDFLEFNPEKQQGAYDSDIRQMGGQIFYLNHSFKKAPFALYKDLKYFFEHHNEYRIVHAHEYAKSGYVLRAAKKMNNPCTISHSHIAYTHTKGLRKAMDSFGKKLLRKNADYCFGCSEDALKDLFSAGADGKKSFVMKNAIDPARFIFSDEYRTSWRKELGADKNTILIGQIARFTNQKNHQMTVHIFKQFLFRYPNSKLVLIGIGDLQKSIETLADDLKIRDNIVFMGSRGDVHEIVNAFDVFLMPSLYEGLGIVLIEAQANGLPCVISKDVIPAEADVNSGLVTRVGLDEPAEVWADACIQAIEKGRLAPEDAQKAVRDAGYDIEEVAQRLQDFYLENWDE